MHDKQPHLDPIAITGMAFKMPQEAVDEMGLWSILERGVNVKTRWPEDRATTATFHDDVSKKPNTLPSHYAHFMTEDPGAFDAPFFSITAKEATSMSPRQRQALEVAYHAFESAGVPVENLRGSLTAVYGGAMIDDWHLMASKDAESVPRMSITGTAASLWPNKISWFFDLRGPSVQVDTACSSGLTALDMACQSILSGSAEAALVLGSSNLLSPEVSLHLANMNFLSPDGCSYSFDSRCNGYGRGEGVVAIYVKPLRQAVHDGDVVRAVIRATSSNQDGRTPGLTQPSIEAQAELIKHTYSKAGLELNKTAYVEAHGTGTPTGDPIESKAIGRVLGKERSPDKPLFLGSIKANIGHLEGASGPASVVKAVMMLERGIIPPQALFKTLNPAIDAVADNIKIPTVKTQWPDSGLRRISVNSFGFGGANAHVILDDAKHYMQLHNVDGFYHSTKDCVAVQANGNRFNTPSVNGINGIINGTVNGDKESTSVPRLLVWSAADEAALHRMLKGYDQYYSTRVADHSEKLSQLAYTLAARRSVMPWRTFAVVEQSHDSLIDQDTEEASTHTQASLRAEKPLRVNAEKTGIGFVFTGQGAQYAGMGVELLRYPIFEQSLRRSDEIFARLGSDWSLFDAIHDEAKISTPEYSQPLCTALQIALVDLLRSFNIIPTAVIGHSSGEIAAAYTVSALTHESSCKAAYYRGILASHLVHQLREGGTPGAMLSANICEDEVPHYLESLGFGFSNERSVYLACVNSSNNVTLSGPVDLINVVKADLEQKGIFAQKLNTGVAYHSPVMRIIAKEYAASLGYLEKASDQSSILMVSSVTGHVIEAEVLATPQYWIDNLVSPVQFAKALTSLTGLKTEAGSSTDGIITNRSLLTDLVEIGPHTALRRPVKEVAPHHRYFASIQRSISSLQSTLQLIGNLFCIGYPIFITLANGQDDKNHPYLVDCPQYPFDHSRRYWDESRISKNWRLRKASYGFLLGRRTHDWNPLKPRWRNWLCVESIPWLGEHHVTGTLVVPGTGSLVIAMEAARQAIAARDRRISGFKFKNVQLLSALRVGNTTKDAVETDVHLDQIQGADGKESTWFQFRLFSHNEGRVTETFNAQIQVEFEEEDKTPASYERKFEQERIRTISRGIFSSCTEPVDTPTFYKRFQKYGFQYGPSFSAVSDAMFDPIGQASGAAKVKWNPDIHEQAGDSPVHPAVLDCVLQVLLATAPKHLREKATIIPRRIASVWISNKVWSQTTKAVHVASAITGTIEEGGPFMNFWAVADDGTPLCAIEKVKGAEISRSEKPGEEPSDQRMLYSIAWKPRLSSLAPGELQKICESTPIPLDNFDSELHTIAEVFPKVELALLSAAKAALQKVSASQMSTLPSYLSKYVDFLGRHTAIPTADLQNQKICKESDPLALEVLVKECEAEYPQWALFPIVAHALPSILRGETDPRELILASNAAETFYTGVLRNHMLSGKFQTFMSLASHENPRLRILEVGARTGSFTRHVLSTLQALESRNGGTSFAEYVFTDKSSSCLNDAQVNFKDHLHRMSFKRWNLEDEASDEVSRLDLGGYDIIFAGNVLHTTRNISETLRRIRTLLRRKGCLVLQEITSARSACMNIGFGILEEWWHSTEDWRQDGPLLTQERWDQLLQDTGFRSINLALKDFEDDAYHFSTIMVAQASDKELLLNGPTNTCRAQHQVVVVTDQNSVSQNLLVEEFRTQCKLKRLVDFGSISQGWEASPSDVVVSLIDVGSSHLATLDGNEFRNLQQLISGSRNILWVAASAHTPASSEDSKGSLPWDPRSGIATGILRTIRSEENDKRIITFTIEQAQSYTSREIAAFITDILHSSFNINESHNSPEVEFVVQGGYITVGRVMHEKQLDAERESHIRPRRQIDEWAAGPPLELEVAKPGLLDSLRYVEDTSCNEDLAADEVEIEAEAWPLSFRDILIALGKITNMKAPGYECAGKVTRVGSACSEQLKPGDRVVMGSFGSMRSRPRSKVQAVLKIPDNLSCVEAVAHANPSMTAWYGLVNLARLQRGEKVLIHSAAGATGQMAIGIAKLLGAEIFATVGSDAKKCLLVEEFNIPEDHILHSRDTSFALGIARLTDGHGVDVILNSLTGESLQASWECIAPFGRFIEIGKADIMANSALPMGIFAKNVTFASVDLTTIVRTNVKLAIELLTTTMGLIASGALRGPTPLHTFPLSEAEKAFRFMQSGNSTGRIVITTSVNDQVIKHLIYKSTWRFDADVTYIVVGGLGGLGRVIIEWMVQKGAMNLLVPSRSGVSSQAALELVERLRGQHIHIETPKCDVSSAEELSKTLEDYVSSMPQAPFKGCINAAMALEDAIFSNMTHEQWSSTIKSKVQSSWNLHTMLPRDMDFFIMLSSLVGVYGAMGQGNYAAGCTFQDALTRARTNASEYSGVSVSLDLGWLIDAGIISEREDYRRRWEDSQDITGVRATDMLAVLDHFCNPARRLESSTDASSPYSSHSQLLVGSVMPADIPQHGEMMPSSMTSPFFDAFRHNDTDSLDLESQVKSPAARFRAAKSSDERRSAVMDALKGRLSGALGVEMNDVDTGRPVSSYGVDSLMAVELRNWIRKDYGVDMAVFDILGGTTVAGLSQLVTTKAEESCRNPHFDF